MWDFARGHCGKTLWIDNGSSFWKSGLIESDQNGMRLADLNRADSICSRHGIVPSGELLAYVSDIARHVEASVRENDVGRICFTGIREGGVLCDENGKVVCGLTNRLLGCPEDAREARRIVEGARGHSLMSIQGYVFGCLTGRPYMTMSEAKALSCFLSNDLRIDPCLSDVKLAPTIAAGRLVDCTVIAGVRAALCGTDEQASVLGAQVIAGSDCLLTTGTFWSLSVVTTPPEPFVGSGIRLVDGDGVLPPFAAMIGYRWGELFWSLMHGHGPAAIDAAPPWASGRLVDEAARSEVKRLEHAIALASGDIADWIERLVTFRRDQRPLAVAVRRTDSPIFHNVVEPLMARLPCESIYMDHDPTAAGAVFSAYLHART